MNILAIGSLIHEIPAFIIPRGLSSVFYIYMIMDLSSNFIILGIKLIPRSFQVSHN